MYMIFFVMHSNFKILFHNNEFIQFFSEATTRHWELRMLVFFNLLQ